MNLLTFDLNLLKVLDALLRERSTVRAGERIGLSQPAVSAALARLRAAFGDPLLVRDGQSMRPTEFALELMAPVAALLAETGRLLARPAFDPAVAARTFRVTGADFFSEMLLPALMADLQRSAPRVMVRFGEPPGPQSFDELHEGRVDLLLLPEAPFPRWVDHRRVLRAAFVLVARRDHPMLDAAGIGPARAMPIELYGRLRHAVFKVIDSGPELDAAALSAAGIDREIALSVTTFSAVWRAAAASDLVGIIPRRMAAKVAGPAGLVLHPLPFPLPRARLCMAWHRRDTAAGDHAWLRDKLAEHLAVFDDGIDPPLSRKQVRPSPDEPGQ
ncbi:LysR family transcriptional regulator [Amaricoccus sp.]|uniref:LysR family transcriptional regulator n=1 Tax=Amaricoccus sp. TaxID=1872485 RepID=UPI002633354C|nr:LysR family transcriptional regulator [uncultured Amaricoccus sp.]